MPEDRLTRRLRRYESQIPDDDPPDRHALEAARALTRWPFLFVGGAIASAAVGLALVVMLSALPDRSAELGPSPSVAPPLASSSSSPRASGLEPSPTTTPRPTTDESPMAMTIAPAVAASSATPTVAWTEGESFAGGAKAVVWWQDRWLAGGSVDGRAAMWQSVDGSSWEQAPPIDPALVMDEESGSSSHSITAITEWDDQIVAAGVNQYGYGDGLNGAMWISSDGLSWEHVDPTSTSLGTTGSHPYDAFIAPDGRLVIVASTHLGSRTLVHATVDGLTWTQHPLSESEDELASVASVALGPSAMVAVGARTVQLADSSFVSVMAIWTSSDGTTWQAAATGDQGYLASVAYDAEGDRFVAGGILNDLGADAAGRPTVWVSDGATWSPVILNDRPGAVWAVAATRGVLLAAGVMHDSSEVVVWESRDGVSWGITTVSVGPTGVPHLGVNDGALVLMVDGSTGPEPAVMRTWTARIEP